MACTVNISEDAQNKYNLPKEMQEAEFNAWLLNGGLQLLADDKKISIDGYKIVDNKFIESLGIGASVVKYVKTSIKKLNKMVYGAEEAGAKIGAKSERQYIDALHEEARKFLKDNKIKFNEKGAIEKAIGKIRDEKSYARFLLTVQSQQDAEKHFEKVEEAQELVDKVNKLKKSDKLTASNKSFINSISFPSAMEISDIEGYIDVLNAFLAKRGQGQSVLGVVDENLKNFIEKESSYIASYKSNIAALKEMLADLALEEEYEALIKEGTFEGTDIESFEDYKAFFEKVAEQVALSERDEKLLDKLDKSNKKKELQNTIKNTIDINREFFNEAFKDYSTDNNVFSFSDIEAINLDNLTFNQLVLLSNVLENILHFNDFVGVGHFTSDGRLSKKRESLFKAVKERVRGFLRGIPNNEDVDRRTIIQTITKIADGGKALYAALDFILGSWNGKIGSIRQDFNETFSKYEKLKNAMAKNSKDLFKSTVRVDTYAFINQWFKADSVENQIAHVKLRVARMASQYASQYKTNVEDTTPTQSRKLELDRSIEGLKALESFGVISNLKISDKEATYDLVEDINLETLNDKLNPKEKAVYDFVVNSYKSLLPDFTKGVNANLGKEFDEVENYYPSFTYRDYDAGNIAISSEANVTPLDLAKEFTPFSKTKSNTKDRSKTLAPSNFKYKMGLSENFSKGLWMTLMTAKASNDMSDMSNILNSSKGLARLKELGLDNTSLNIIKQKLKEKVDADMVYGNVNPRLETAVSDELKKLRNNLIVGFILKDFTQLFKQGMSPLFTSAIFNLKLTTKALFSTNTKEAQSAISFLVQNTSIQSRLAVYEQSSTITDTPIENLRGEQAAATRAIRGYINIQEKYISDIVVPLFKIFNRKAKYDSILEAADAYVSVINIIVGYVKNRQKQNPKLTFEDVIAELNNGVIDGQSIQAAEKYQEDMNAPSNQNDAAKVLKEDKNKLIYFMKSFPLATSMSFNAAKEDLLTSRLDDLEADVASEKAGILGRFIVQQALYRTINHFALSYLAEIVAKTLFGAGDEDDEYELQKKFLSLGAGLGSDLFLGKYNIFYEMAYTLAVNAGFRFYASKELEKRKEVDPNFDSKALKTNLVMESKMGGAQTFSIELFKTGERTYNLLSKREEETPATDPVVETATRTFLPLLSGSGTVRYFTNKANAAAKEEEMRINLIYSDIAGKFGFQYGLSEGDLQSVLSDLKDAKFSEIRGRLLFKPVREDYGILYVLTKEDMEKAKKEANIALYGKGNPTREDILKSSVIGKLNLNPNASEETKLALAGKKYKEVYNKLLDSYILKAKAYQVTAKK
jgi:hypothetical protein